MTNEVDIGSITNDRKLELIPPSDPRVQCAIAPLLMICYQNIILKIEKN